MPLMADKKPKPKPAAEEPLPVQHSFRPDDPRLLKALDIYAAQERRSRNMAIQLIIEEKLTQAGLWPPKS